MRKPRNPSQNITLRLQKGGENATANNPPLVNFLVESCLELVEISQSGKVLRFEKVGAE